MYEEQYKSVRGYLDRLEPEDKICFFMGVPIEMFDKEELQKLVRIVGNMYTSAFKQHREEMEFLSELHRKKA